MSFILDALKKLEQKKQDASVPDLLTVHTAEQYEAGKRSFWPIIVIALLLLNAGVVSYWMLSERTEDVVVAEVDTRENQEQAAPPESEKTNDREISVDSAPDQPVQTAVKEEVIERTPDKVAHIEEMPAQPPIPEKTRVQKEAQEPVPVESKAEISDTADETPLLDQLIRETSSDTEKMTALQRETTQNADADQDTANPSEVHPLSAIESETEKQLPTISELPADVRKEIPDLTIIAHIYSNNPSSRMVNINGDVLREGDTLSDTLKLEEITVSGVTFNYKDHRFRLRAF
jgi:general secretion pathway protein B